MRSAVCFLDSSDGHTILSTGGVHSCVRLILFGSYCIFLSVYVDFVWVTFISVRDLEFSPFRNFIFTSLEAVVRIQVVGIFIIYLQNNFTFMHVIFNIMICLYISELLVSCCRRHPW